MNEVVVFRAGIGYTGLLIFLFQAEDGIRDLVRSRGLGDVYKRQPHQLPLFANIPKKLKTISQLTVE